MNNKYCAFDIEIVKEIPNGTEDWRQLRPLGISCAATILSDAEKPMLWYHGMENHEPLPGAMTEHEVCEMLDYLIFNQSSAYRLVTWNGLQFDFDVLAEESNRHKDCVELAMNHVDIMFHFFCLKGYMLGMNTAAHGLGLQGKTEGMHGDLAPVMWAKTVEDRLKVLEYVGQDVITTLQIAEAVERTKRIDWVSKSGKSNSCYFTNRQTLLTVQQCLGLPSVDQSWMNNPKTKESFYKWATE